VPVGRLALAERVPRRDVRTRTQLFVADVAVVRVRAHAEVVQRARRVRGGIPVITLFARDIGAVAEGRTECVGIVREHATHVPNEWFITHEHEFHKDARRLAVGG
jgi:hypothetical protein